MIGESEKGCSSGDFKMSDQFAMIDLLGAHKTIDKQIFRNGLRAQLSGQNDALVKANQMRRGIDLHALSEGLRDSSQKSDQGTFSVGAGDMYHRRQAFFRVVKSNQQAPK